MMKRTILFFFCILSSLFSFVYSEEIPLKKIEPPQPTSPAGPRAPFLFPVSAYQLPTDVYLSFSTPVGVALIIIKDQDGYTASQQTIDTDTVTELYIPVTDWDSSAYTIQISYGSIILEGKFNL
jgi:hypothetical protein